MNRFEIMKNFYSSKTLFKMAGGECIRSISHIPPLSASHCIITKNGFKFKKKCLRHDCCKEVKGMLSGESGKTIFKCWRFNVFLSNNTSSIFA